MICDFVSFPHRFVAVIAHGALYNARFLARAVLDNAFAAEAVPAGAKHRRAPLLCSEVVAADTARKLLPAESEIRRIPLSRRKDRVFPAAPLVATGTRKENRRTFGFFRTWARNALLGQLAVAAFGGSALAFDAVSAQRVTTAENEGRPRFSVGW